MVYFELYNFIVAQFKLKIQKIIMSDYRKYEARLK